MNTTTTEELMELFNVTAKTIYRWRKEGMPYQKIGHKTIRYDKEAVIKWKTKRDNQA